jgi:hypothetical protein
MRQVSVFRQQRETNEHCPAAAVGHRLRAASRGRARISRRALAAHRNRARDALTRA